MPRFRLGRLLPRLLASRVTLHAAPTYPTSPILNPRAEVADSQAPKNRSHEGLRKCLMAVALEFVSGSMVPGLSQGDHHHHPEEQPAEEHNERKEARLFTSLSRT